MKSKRWKPKKLTKETCNRLVLKLTWVMNDLREFQRLIKKQEFEKAAKLRDKIGKFVYKAIKESR